MKPNSIVKTARISALFALLFFAQSSLAVPILFEATIDGAQANAGAGTGSAGTGSAVMTFEDSTNVFSWDIQWENLTGPALAGHFHGPAAPDANAGIEVDFGGISGLASPSIGNTVIDATQAADLLAGLWYINIHTGQFLGGEIRGQVVRSDTPVPLPSSFALLLLAVAGFAARRAGK
ncbi:MAG: CHRD domain-containing protein [Halioglobus sp.]|nr:CHRD domain-containing protein [Halioglobus sp.]